MAEVIVSLNRDEVAAARERGGNWRVLMDLKHKAEAQLVGSSMRTIREILLDESGGVTATMVVERRQPLRASVVGS